MGGPHKTKVFNDFFVLMLCSLKCSDLPFVSRLLKSIIAALKNKYI